MFLFCQFRFADNIDILLMVLGTIGALANGIALPSLMIVFGEMTDSFIEDALRNSTET